MSTWDDKPNDYEHALRLLALCRNDTIEECALVADGFGYNMDIAKMLATAIRALKDKP